MKFTIDKEQIVCERRGADGERSVIVSFDAKLDAVAPHVAAALSLDEQAQLESWFTERRMLRAKPRWLLVLEVLPAVLESGRDALEAAPQIEEGLYKEITKALDAFRSDLKQLAQKRTPGFGTQLELVEESDALKERLSVLIEDCSRIWE